MIEGTRSSRSIGISRRGLGLGSIALAAGSPWPAPAQGAAPQDGSEKARVTMLLPALEDYVRKGMTDWHVPGAAVGVVVDEDIVFAKGFGVRAAPGDTPVGANTIFQIGSTTKAFAAAAEAIVVDRGKMKWADRVIDHYPDFRLYDPWVTREFQIIDLLAQRSGLRPYVLDPMWVLGYSPEDVIAGLRYAHPVSSFRTTFSYQNVLQAIAGRIVARHTGEADWVQAVRTLILDPLGMSSTTATVRALLGSPDHAAGHIWRNGQLAQFDPLPDFDAVGPAGALNSSVADLLKWLRLQIGRGSFEGKRIISEANLTETWRPRVDMPIPGFPVDWAGYASGWIFQATANGHFVWHNGGTGLFKAHVGFIPDRRVGFVMLTNEGTNALPDSVALWFYDRVLGNPQVDHSARYLAIVQEQTRKAEERSRRPDHPAPPATLADYAGQYHSPVLKAATIEPAGEHLRLTFAATGLALLLKPWNGDAFALASDDRSLSAMLGEDGSQLMQFMREPSGRVNELRFIDNPELSMSRGA